MKKQLVAFTFSFLTLCISLPAYCQLFNIPAIGNEVMKESKYVDIEGSPYFYGGWKSGSITDKNGKIYEGQLIRYDTYKDVIEINQEGKILALSNLIYVRFDLLFVEENSSIVTHRLFRSGFSVPKYSEKDYFEVVHEGVHTVLKKIKTEFLEDNVSSYGSNRTVKKFVADQRYFLLTNSGDAKEFKVSKKSFLEALGKDKEAAEKFMESSKIKVKTEAELKLVLMSLR